jgi:hypothetical protein
MAEKIRGFCTETVPMPPLWTPPDDAEYLVHMGGCVIEQDGAAKLPSGAIAWSERSGPWMDPAMWPHGQYAEGEHEKILREARLAAQEAFHDNRFDERGRVADITKVSDRP